jgi:hypothetical protein
MKQHEAVIKVMEQNGGFATLGHLYQNVLKIPDCKWGTKTPFASVRRIVQTHSDLFFKIRPGLWALAGRRAEVLAKLALAGPDASTHDEQFNHSYFQGLIIEIGNLRHFETFAPSQDKNKPYLGKHLSDVVSLRQCYDFTYDHLVQKAKMIDVTWFNDRKLPNAFFEVEHSTDFYNSLLKYAELQDFYAEFKIVADAARYPEYQAKLSNTAFKQFAKRVTFVSYDTVSELHAKEFELSLIHTSM